MTAEEVLRQARAMGATFQVLESGRLKVRAPAPLPASLMEGLRQHKDGILALLAGEVPADAPAGSMESDGTASLLVWAAQAAEKGLVLPEPVQFLETPLRPCTTADVGRYCREKLRFLALARSNRKTGGWGSSPRSGGNGWRRKPSGPWLPCRRLLIRQE